jgi:protease-4
MRVILWIFAVLGFATTLLLALAVFAVFHFANRPVPIDPDTVLTLDLTHPITEASHGDSLGRLLQDDRSVAFTAVLEGLKRGGDDPKVKGLIATASNVRLALGQAQELRNAIAAFRAKGKFAFAYADSFGDIGGGTKAYYVASGFDQIWLQPVGGVGLTGLDVEVPFFKGSLDKLGVTAEFERRGEYKTAATQFTDTKLPDTDRHALESVFGSVFDQLVQGISEGRSIPADQVRALIDAAPYSAEEALAKHLIDEIGYQDEVESAARARAGNGAKLMPIGRYAAASRPPVPPGLALAVIDADGMITGGRSDDGALDGGTGTGSETMVEAFAAAVKDPAVKAIVLRIDSPGGSEVASETIWRAVKQAQQAGKPVIVSMAGTAASGGYYIAAPADKIVAEPLTITGSIGVFGGKFVLAGLFDKLGVSFDTVTRGQNAGMGSDLTNFTPQQQARFAAFMDASYKSFVARVADGRHMDPAAVDAVARGQEWTGAQAKERGLVDALGGLDLAVQFAKQSAHIADDAPVELKPFPRRTQLQQLLAGIVQSNDDASAAALTLRRLAALGPLLDRLEGLGAGPGVEAKLRPMQIDP